MENTISNSQPTCAPAPRQRIATLLFFLILIFQKITHTQCEEVINQKSNITTMAEIYENTDKNSTTDNSNIRQRRQLGYYPWNGGGYYRPRPIPIILDIGVPIFGRPGFGGRGFGFGRPGLGGRGFGGFGGRGFGGFGGFGGRGFGGFGGRGFGGRGFGGFGGRGFGGFGGRGFGGRGFGGRGFGGFGGRGFGGFGGRGFGGFGGRGFGGGRGGRG